MKWSDVEEIAMALYNNNPNIDPLTVRFTDLHKQIIELPEFSDDAKGSNEQKLEAIQMAWYEEYK